MGLIFRVYLVEEANKIEPQASLVLTSFEDGSIFYLPEIRDSSLLCTAVSNLSSIPAILK